MFKVGLIGCGIISVNHMDALDEIADAKIIAVCDVDEEKLNRAMIETGVKGYRDYKEMAEKEPLDLVIINLPHALHREAACYCAGKGINILLEKPMGISSADCIDMINTCRENNVMLWVGHPQRYVPTNIFAKKLIASGQLGELVSYSETRNGNYFSEERPAWFLKKELSGGGIMINLGAHSLDKMKFFTDSTIADISGQVHIRPGYDCEDSAQAFVKMSNGVTGTLNLIGHTAVEDNRTTLYLTKGEVRINTDGTVDWCGEDGEFKKHECEDVSCMTYQMQDVIRIMRDKSFHPVVSGEYGLDIIHAVKKVYGEEN